MPKFSTKEINEQRDEAFRALTQHGHTYRHYKGGIYRVLALDYDTEADGEAVVDCLRVRYSRIDGPNFSLTEGNVTFTRPYSMWFDAVDPQPKVAGFSQSVRFVACQKVERWETTL